MSETWRAHVDSRPLLEHLEAQREAGADGTLAALAFVAAQAVHFSDRELDGARRRAVFVLAAGGDPHRHLAPDGRAVRTLAGDLDAPERRAELGRSLDALRLDAGDLPTVAAALDRLLADGDLAWRWLACALLAAEISGEGDD